MSLVDEVLGRDCAFCSGPADEVDALASTYERCPGCARSLRDDDPEPEEPARRVLRARDEWPGFDKRGNGRTS